MDLDIQFGELEESQPEARLRPDRNKHYAVVAYEAPGDDDLPIFVDLDVMRDIEVHAESDTSVELGGVLLGCQCEDENGDAYVIVTDSLRARHFEATKGSFKFTHDTWEEISRERDEFPADLQMVGWYHTHPDWGVFLSGMDMFICDNFFNRPLDLALVVDPCRGDRGMFQWTGDPGERIRRTGGFYLIASRFRRRELEMTAAQLEGKFAMATDPRFSTFPMHAGAAPAPVVNIAEQRNPWQAIAVMGMLSVQLMVLALLAWKIIGPLVPAETAAAEKPASTKKIAALEKSVESIEERYDDRLRNEAHQTAQRQVLDALIAHIEGNPNKLTAHYEAQQLDVDRLAAAVDGLRAGKRELEREKVILENRVDKQENDYKSLSRQEKAAQKEISALSSEKKNLSEKVDAFEKEVEKLQKTLAGDNPWPASGYLFWLSVGGALLGGGLIGGVIVGLTTASRQRFG